MAYIKRDSEWVSITGPSVVAISEKVRLYCYMNDVGESRLCIEGRNSDGEWQYSTDPLLRSEEKCFRGIKNRIGGNYAFCHVFRIIEVESIIAKYQLRFVARVKQT